VLSAVVKVRSGDLIKWRVRDWGHVTRTFTHTGRDASFKYPDRSGSCSISHRQARPLKAGWLGSYTNGSLKIRTHTALEARNCVDNAIRTSGIYALQATPKSVSLAFTSELQWSTKYRFRSWRILHRRVI
jgi:hypothetical protein